MLSLNVDMPLSLTINQVMNTSGNISSQLERDSQDPGRVDEVVGQEQWIVLHLD